MIQLGYKNSQFDIAPEVRINNIKTDINSTQKFWQFWFDEKLKENGSFFTWNRWIFMMKIWGILRILKNGIKFGEL